MANQYTPHTGPKTDLRLLMESRGHSIQTLSVAAGIGYFTIQRVVSGKTDIMGAELRTFLGIAKGLGMTPAQLLKALGLDK